jgi:hypothetical protein
MYTKFGLRTLRVDTIFKTWTEMVGLYENGSSRNRMGLCGLESHGSGWGLVASPCEHGNELQVFIK